MHDVSTHSSPSHRSYVDQCVHYLARRHDCVPAGPVIAPAAWRGEDYADEELRIAFTADQIEELDAALRFGKSTGRALANWTVDEFPLPHLTADFERWRNEIEHGRGFVVLSGIPVERWGTDDCERFFWAFGLHLGIPGAQNVQGDLLGHVIDTGRNRSDPMIRLYQTPENIGYHCDAADVVGLLCLQSAVRGGASRIVSSVTVWNEIWRRDPRAAARLFEPVYVDLRGEIAPDGRPWNVVTPCTYADNVLRTFYHGDYFRSVARHQDVRLSDADRRLLDLYDEIANTPGIYLDMELAPGDIQLISNHTVVHARTAYEDTPERRRHLLRLWISL